MDIEHLSRKAVILYGYISGCGGGALDEWQLRDKTGLSHGSVCAARKELVEAGLLTLGKEGRKMIYQLTSPEDESENDQSENDPSAVDQSENDREAENAPQERAESVAESASALQVVPPPPAPKAAVVKAGRRKFLLRRSRCAQLGMLICHGWKVLLTVLTTGFRPSPWSWGAVSTCPSRWSAPASISSMRRTMGRKTVIR